MDFFKEILTQILVSEEVSVSFPNLKTDSAGLADLAVIFELTCYKALQRIKAIIKDDSLSDFDCVEAIVREFEELGGGGGSRHDF